MSCRPEPARRNPGGFGEPAYQVLTGLGIGEPVAGTPCSVRGFSDSGPGDRRIGYAARAEALPTPQ